MIDGRLVSEVTPKRKSAAEVNEFVELPQIEAREEGKAIWQSRLKSERMISSLPARVSPGG
jgi:hypothetical protein